jgi:processive 1,2-diacylglycerol beta-glucosyltransferase
MKKVLILTASTGDGHNEAAESLVDAFAANNYNAIKFDFLKSSSQLWNAFVVGGYKLLTFNCPKLYGNLYRFSNFNAFNRIIPSILLKSIEEGLLSEINRHNPDIIVGTHAFAVTIVSKLKKKSLINVPFVSIVTDFKAHGSYIDDEVDAYITGSEYTRLNMFSSDVPEYKIFPYGIPIRKDFLSNKDFKDKLPNEYFSVLLMGGGMGLKFITPVLKKLTENGHKLNIVVVCGKNKLLKEALDKEYTRKIINKKVHILGFTRNIPELMNEADVIITKPGGLTVSEAIAKGLPMLLPYAIPGQEQENMSFLFSKGAAVDMRKIDNFNDVLNNLIEHPERLDEIRKNLNKIFKDYSIENIVELSNHLIKHDKGFKHFKSKVINVTR